jgi:hypothetical protein
MARPCHTETTTASHKSCPRGYCTDVVSLRGCVKSIFNRWSLGKAQFLLPSEPKMQPVLYYFGEIQVPPTMSAQVNVPLGQCLCPNNFTSPTENLETLDANVVLPIVVVTKLGTMVVTHYGWYQCVLIQKSLSFCVSNHCSLGDSQTRSSRIQELYCVWSLY